MKGLVIGLLAASTLTLGVMATAEHTRATEAEAKVVQLDKDVDQSVDQWIEAQAEIKNLSSQVDYWHQAWHDATVSASTWRQRFGDVAEKYTSLYGRVHSRPAPFSDCPWDRAVRNAYGQVIGCRGEPPTEVHVLGTSGLLLGGQ